MLSIAIIDLSSFMNIYFIEQIDSLDTLALLGDKEKFGAAVEWVGKNVRFDIVSKHVNRQMNLVLLATDLSEFSL